MSQYNKLSNYQHARFQILSVHLHFGLFWSAGIPTIMEDDAILNDSLEKPREPRVRIVILDGQQSHG